MFKKPKEINILTMSVVAFGLVLESFYFTPQILILVLGYFVVLGSSILHYDIHLAMKDRSPFLKALESHKHIPDFIKKWGFIAMRALHLRFKHLYHQDYIVSHLHFLIQPTFLYWSAASLLFFFINPWFSQGVIIATTLCYFLLMASISQIYQKGLKITEDHIHLLSITKVLVVFLSFFAAYGYYYFGFIGVYQELALIMGISFIFLYKYVWKTGQLFKKRFAWAGVFWASILITGLGFLVMWANLAYFLSVVVLFAAYFLFFGIIKHYLKGDLTKRMVLEFLISAILLIGLVWANSYFDNLIL